MSVLGVYRFIHLIKEIDNAWGGERRGPLGRKPTRKGLCGEGKPVPVWLGGTQATSEAAEREEM